MTVRLDPGSLRFAEFGGLEPHQPQWLQEKEYWEDYNHRFFRSNGRQYQAEDSNVDTWLTANDRAPHAFMARELLDRMQPKIGAAPDIDLVLFAHWLPDLHLGTSVTNFAQHHLGIRDGFGFAISDRGRSAPFFAMQCIERYLRAGHRRALLLVMDQRHLLYRSPMVDVLNPVNCAAAMVFDNSAGEGPSLGGYQRLLHQPGTTLQQGLRGLLDGWGCDPHTTTVVADPQVLDAVGHSGKVLAQNPRHLCAAPFAALAEAGLPKGDTVLLCHDQQALTAVLLGAQKVAPTKGIVTQTLVPR